MLGKNIFRTTCLPVIVLLVSVGVVGCNNPTCPLPAFQEGPGIIALDQLLQDYQADPQRAATIYEGNIYLFPEVLVDQIFNLRTLQTEEYLKGEMFVSHGKMKFFPKYIYDLDHIASGFVVDIVGEVRGWNYGFCSIVDCTYCIVRGGELPPPGSY